VHLQQHSTLRELNARLASRALERGDGYAVHRPRQLFVQIASACNLDCYMCSEHNRPVEWRHGRGLVAFAPELFDKLADGAFEHAEGITFGVGGEPTISPHFEHFVERSHGAGLRVDLVTNGTRLTVESTARTVAERVADVQISLDGATKDTYERIRRGSSWAHMRSGLKKLNDFRLAMPERDRTHVTFCFVLMRSNVRELPAFIQMAREFHADAVHAQHVIPVTDDSRDEPLIGEPELYDSTREVALRTAAELGMPLHLPEPYASSLARAGTLEREPESEISAAPAVHPIRCPMPALDLYVLYDGRVYPCCHPFAHSKMLLGDLRTQSFEEIWNGRTARNLRAGLRLGDVPSICRNCSIANDPPPAFEDPREIARSQDLAAWYGERDLDPPGSSAAILRALDESRDAIDEHAAVARDAQRSADARRAHVVQLESQRVGLEAHSANLASELAPLREHALRLERELAATGFTVREGVVAPMAAEIGAQRDHIANLEPELASLRAHAGAIESDRAGLRAHSENLERELAGLRAHAHNLERELAALRERVEPY
jgi:radical SAM protein with 4Fe4S-binding SPASM domain